MLNVCKNKSEKRRKKLELDRIAEMLKQGIGLTDIGIELGESKQTIYYRVGILKEFYPELLKEEA